MKQNRGEFRKSDAQNNHLLGDGQFPLGIISGLLIAIIIYLLLDFSEQWPSRTELINIVPTLSTLLVAFVSLLLSFRALIEQKKMRQAGTDPVLIAHLKSHEDKATVTMLNISNVGSGVALNVSIRIEKPDKSIEGFELIDNIFAPKQEIKAILQNNSLSYNIGMSFNLLKDEGLPPFNVSLRYQDIEGSFYSSKHTINVQELRGRTVLIQSGAKIWKELEGIKKEISKLS